MSANKLIYRNHAIKRMFERGIGEDDVRAVIDLGEVIQGYQDDAPYPSRLILGWCKVKTDLRGRRLQQPGKNRHRDHRL